MARIHTEERQVQIIDEAIRIIHESGYGALGIRRLAQRVGITEPAIYRHFSGKDEIIVGILDRVLKMGDMMLSRVSRSPDSRTKIKNFVLFHFEFLQKKPELTSIVFSENLFHNNPVLKVKLKTIIYSRHQLLKGLLDAAQKQNVLADVDTDALAVLIIGNIRLIVLEWRLSDFEFDLLERGQRAWVTLEKLIFV
ncbi:MAG TPA: TetR/AcrR family transcriptional regulator [Bacteroidetes bacterium]|nr:TetR/AcrR family transcriptional regulator [Bacteroidota bacterium]